MRNSYKYAPLHTEKHEFSNARDLIQSHCTEAQLENKMRFMYKQLIATNSDAEVPVIQETINNIQKDIEDLHVQRRNLEERPARARQIKITA
jgi:hypothetical protein